MAHKERGGPEAGFTHTTIGEALAGRFKAVRTLVSQRLQRITSGS